MRRIVRDELAQPIDLAIGHAKHPADIAQHRARLQFAEGDDLRDAVAPVFLLDVADHLVAPVLAEIDVEIRHRHPLGVEKPLEQEAEAQRVEIGDRQGPGDDRASPGAAPGPNRDAVALRPLDDVGDDQEITGKAHPDDRPELEIEALAIGACGGVDDLGTNEPFVQPRLRGAPQGGFLVEAVDRRERRQDRLARLREEGAAAGDDEGVVADLRQIGEERPHLCGRSEEMMRGQPLAFLVGDDRRLGDAEQRVMRLVKLAIGEMGVVGCDERQVVPIGQLDEARFGSRLFRRPMAHQLDIEPAREKARELGQRSLSGLGLALREKPTDRDPAAPRRGKAGLRRLGRGRRA